MPDVTFAPSAWADYLEWQTADKKIAVRINTLIKDIQRNGLMNGIGKPEALRGRKGYSRRITVILTARNCPERTCTYTVPALATNGPVFLRIISRKPVRFRICCKNSWIIVK